MIRDRPHSLHLGDLKHRAEIDGLRAVSILGVVLYHAGIPFMSGGFVGVDVFFVISGYLITGLVHHEMVNTGSVDFFRFYARRVRRLLPAALLVLAVTLVLGLMLLRPSGEQQDLASSVTAALLFTANNHFASTVGYFDGPAETKVLLHMWSLSVEEQFYLVWPITLLALVRATRSTARRPVLVVSVTIVAASFAGMAWAAQHAHVREAVLWLAPVALVACIWLVHFRDAGAMPCLVAAIAALSFSAAYAALLHGHAREAFFWTPLRAWELLAGAVLALGVERAFIRRGAPIMGLSAGVGLAAILLAFVALNSTSPFPGLRALIPVAGTCLVIAATAAAPLSATTSLLSAPILQLIGRWSYSWYLWHWPLLAIARTVRGPTLSGDLAVLAASLFLAGMTVRWVEAPMRFALWRGVPARRVVAVGVAASLLLTAFAWGTGALASQRATEFDRAYRADFDPRPDLRPSCFINAPEHLDPFPSCRFDGPDSATIVVWGDSHAEMWLPAALKFSSSAPRPLSVLQATKMNCQPFVGSLNARGGRGQSSECLWFNRTVLQHIRETAQRIPVTVLLGGRWTYFSEVQTRSISERQAGDRAFRSGDSLVLAAAYQETLDSLGAIGVRALVAQAIPELPQSAPECVKRWHWQPAACSISRREAEARTGSVRRALDRVTAEHPLAATFDPVPIICDSERCWASRSGIILYKDDDHLGSLAAESMLNHLTERQRQWLNPRAVSVPR